MRESLSAALGNRHTPQFFRLAKLCLGSGFPEGCKLSGARLGEVLERVTKGRANAELETVPKERRKRHLHRPVCSTILSVQIRLLQAGTHWKLPCPENRYHA